MSTKNGYHVASIERHPYGTAKKIREELFEFEDAITQENLIMALQELSDLIGAIEGYLEHEFAGVITLDHLLIMKDATSRAFRHGHRQSSEKDVNRRAV